MQSRRTLGSGWTGLFLLALAFTGCATTQEGLDAGKQPPNSGRLIAELAPDIERLYLGWQEVDQTYKDIKSLERAFLFDVDDRQLGAIQKVGLYVQDASLRIFNQWERLSVLHYIRSEMLRDYLTLCVKGLREAIDAIAYDQMFIRIYRLDITHASVVGDVERSQAGIEKQAERMNRLVEKLLPLANVTAASDRI